MEERMKEEITWKEASTLEEWVIRMIEQKKTKEPEFQNALRVFGREKLKAIWEKHKASKGE
jgi:hypothetical protein